MSEQTIQEKLLAVVAAVSIPALSAVELQNVQHIKKSPKAKAPNKWALFTLACTKLLAIGAKARYSLLREAVKGVIPNLPEEAAILADAKKAVGAKGFYDNHRAKIGEAFYQLSISTPTIGEKREVVVAWKLQEAKEQEASASPPAPAPAAPPAAPATAPPK